MERERERERHRETQRETDRETERERQKERDGKREKVVLEGSQGRWEVRRRKGQKQSSCKVGPHYYFVAQQFTVVSSKVLRNIVIAKKTILHTTENVMEGHYVQSFLRELSAKLAL